MDDDRVWGDVGLWVLWQQQHTNPTKIESNSPNPQRILHPSHEQNAYPHGTFKERQDMSRYLNAFGVADCETEIEQLKDRYKDVFFGEVPFCEDAAREETYLIVGRRGSGKTALSHYFGFRDSTRTVHLIDVDEPEAFASVLTSTAIAGSDDRQLAISRLVKVWDHAIWCIIFRSLAEESAQLAEICDRYSLPERKNILEKLLKGVLAFLGNPSPGDLDDRFDQLSSLASNEAKELVLDYAAATPIYVAMDTLEQYDVSKTALMYALAALVQYAAAFNAKYSTSGIHLKVFMAGEVFPYLKEEVILNTLKAVKNPVYLVWRPRDLLRLISWRFYRFLKSHRCLDDESKKSIDWDNPTTVHKRMWIPYFGASVVNGKGYPENSFAYILRHTQMRPRQLITICNQIAKCSTKFPYFASSEIVSAVATAEAELLTRQLNIC
jgi:KaiC/GvpD/RAD55 family RecA-like ATPase